MPLSPSEMSQCRHRPGGDVAPICPAPCRWRIRFVTGPVLVDQVDDGPGDPRNTPAGDQIPGLRGGMPPWVCDLRRYAGCRHPQRPAVRACPPRSPWPPTDSRCRTHRHNLRPNRAHLPAACGVQSLHRGGPAEDYQTVETRPAVASTPKSSCGTTEPATNIGPVGSAGHLTCTCPAHTHHRPARSTCARVPHIA